jgi:hypothetical protein
MSLYDRVIPLYLHLLPQVSVWLDKAIAHAEKKRFDPEILFSARLAPDQFAFAKQVQSACDTAKFVAAKLSGTEPPSHPDTEKTLADLRARVNTCIEYLRSFTPAQFEGAEERACSHVWMRGKHLRGDDYVAHYAIPNFFFHYTTAYSILRAQGVDVGKLDFLGGLPFRD